MSLATQVVTIEPWNPWPLVFPAIVIVVAVMASVVGTRFTSRPVREVGYTLFVVGGLAAAWMTWSLSGLWDTSARQAAFIGAGYESPTFSGTAGAVGDELPPLSWQAVQDGERVRGVLRPLGDDQWEIREIRD